MTSLNVVALISGGKDSFFSILHCLSQGHRVIALGNLHPPSKDQDGPVDDMDSYMYQTIGHAVIPLYEKALGLPLYRQEINGTAANQDKSYHQDGPDGEGISDETESLVPLLRKVLAAHPEINALSTGAILSDYQRTRVESVALRLGLIPLAFLWQWPSITSGEQTSLLEDMATVGQDSRIVKVASGGMDESFLWQNVSDAKVIARLSKAAERFGSPGDGAALGEGGEYETLTVDGPMPLWKHSIIISPEKVHVVPGDAGSASVRIDQSSFGTKVDESPSLSDLRIPALLDTNFQKLLDQISLVPATDLPEPQIVRMSIKEALVFKGVDNQKPDELQTFPNIVTLPRLFGQGTTIDQQTRSIMDQLVKQLSNHSQSARNVAYAVVVLRKMSDFVSFNAIYGTYFMTPNPPARVTVACADVLPEDSFLMISFTSVAGPKEGLHVQSRSYWAPANIGPYSQAIKPSADPTSSETHASVYIAGQIPLVPASMEPIKPSTSNSQPDFARDTVLALQHLIRIGAAMKVKRWACAIAFVMVSQTEETKLSSQGVVLRRAWEELHSSEPVVEILPDEDENFDVWDVQNRHGNAAWLKADSTNHALPANRSDPGVVPPLYLIAVDSLPRGCSIEWVGYGETDDSLFPSAPLHLQTLLHTFRHQFIPDVSDVIQWE